MTAFTFNGCGADVNIGLNHRPCSVPFHPLCGTGGTDGTENQLPDIDIGLDSGILFCSVPWNEWNKRNKWNKIGLILFRVFHLFHSPGGTEQNVSLR